MNFDIFRINLWETQAPELDHSSTIKSIRHGTPEELATHLKTNFVNKVCEEGPAPTVTASIFKSCNRMH